MSDFDFSDINLDFLQSTPPKRPQGNQRIGTPTIKSEIDVGPRVVGGKKVKSKKFAEWAKKIASADELITEIKKLKCEKLELQAQLRDFQKSALTIQDLYTTEKRASELMSKDIKQLQEKFERADADLTIKNLKCDQLEGQLEIHKDRPVDYNVLVVKYLRILNKIDEEEYQRNFTDRLMIDNLRQYCVKYKLKAPPAACPKQSKPRRLQKEDAAVQCELLKDVPIVVKPTMKTQSTQCQPEMRSQGSQHISTMTTRGTTTACFIKYRTVGTSFPESQSIAGVDEILREFAPWQNITPISPLIDQPATSSGSGQVVTKTCRSIGTCTWLCNIRRTIDFMPRNKQQLLQSARPPSSCDVSNSHSIKQEVTTPSPSPTPNAQATVTSNQTNNVTASQSATPTATLSQNTGSNPLFAALQSSLPLRHLSGSSFDGLWHIFGRMLLGLLQTSNATNATAANQEAVNQHQFHSWLRELYESSATASGTNGGEQSEAVTAHNVATSPINIHTSDSPTIPPDHSDTLARHTVATSPLHFNQISPFGSPNIIRPQPRRSYAGEDRESQEDIPQEDDHTPDILIDNLNCDSHSASTSDNESHHGEILNKETLTSFGSPQKPHKKRKEHKMLYEIQELFPGTKLSKSKRKALKRLLKSEKQKKKKSLKDTKIDPPLPNNDSIASDNISNNITHEEETAVDFLKGIFESSNPSSQMETIDEIQEFREDNKHEDMQYICDNGRDRAKHDVKNSIEIVRVENIRNYKLETNTNGKEEVMFHELPANTIQQFNNTVDLNIDDSANFKKPKNVNKNFSFSRPMGVVCKKSMISNKIELYTSLFGDSDTEMEDGDDDLQISNGNEKEILSFEPPVHISELPKNSCRSELETSGDEEDFKCNSSSQNANCFDEEYSEDDMEISPNKNNSTFSQVSEPNVCVSETKASKYDDMSTRFSQNTKFSDEDYKEVDMDVSQNRNINNFLKSCEQTTCPSETQENNTDVNVTNQVVDGNVNEKCASSAKNFDENSCNSEEDDSHDDQENFNRNVGVNSTCAATENLLTRLDVDNGAQCVRAAQRSENNCKIDNVSDVLVRRNIILYPVENVNAHTLSVDKSNNNLDSFHPQKHCFDEFEQDLHTDLSQSDGNSISDMSTPVLKAFEMPQANETATNLLFGQTDKETQERLDTVIDQQLKKIPANREEYTIAALSEFEKDFELSSDEDDNLVTETTFLVSTEVATNEMCAKRQQCRASSDTVNDMEIITSEEDNVKDCSETQTNCNTTRTIKSGHPIVGVMKGASDFKEAVTAVPKNNNTFIIRSFTEVDSRPVKCMLVPGVNTSKQIGSKSSKPDNLTVNSCDNHADIASKNNSTSRNLTDVSNSPLRGTLASIVNTPDQSAENMTTTDSEEEVSVIEVSSDITNVEKTANENELLIHESPGDNIDEAVASKQNTTEAVSNFPYFPLGKCKSKEHISRLSLEDKISVVEISPKYNVMEETLRNKSNKLIVANEKEPLQIPKSTENSSSESCVLKSPPSSSMSLVSEVILELNSFQHPNGRDEDTLASSTDEEISVINISTDNTSIENERRDITTTPNDELIIDDDSDETEEEKQDIKQKLQNPEKSIILSVISKTNATLKIPQQCQKQSTEINFDSGNSKKANISTPNSMDNHNTSSEISSLLSSTLYTDILSDSMLPLVDDVLRDDDLITKLFTPDKKPQTRGRKRKSECQLKEEQPACKRSERLRARTSKLSITPVEIGKYTRVNRSSISDLKSNLVDKVPKKEVIPDMPVMRMGFFREIGDSKTDECSKDDSHSTSLQCKKNEEAVTGDKNSQDLSNIIETLRPIHGNDKSLNNDPQIDGSVTAETVATYKLLSRQTALNNYNTTNLKQIPLTIDTSSSKQNTSKYPESPLSPLPHEDTIDTLLNTATLDIPLELSPQYRPKTQTNSLLENLMIHFSPGQFSRIATVNSQTGDNFTKREKVILAQYENALKDYCCSPMQLDPDIMASRVMGTLQQYSIEYPLLCCVILKLAKNAEASLVKDKDLPSIIQEMPPRHLCLSLQRLFYLLKHLTSVNSTFCVDLLKKIDTTLFNIQQSERITLTSSVNLIQLYLMSCKHIENELSQHPARILIAKCLYFHAIKSISMIHEVLMWYPTVMPPKEDRTYDRSDALITVIQQLLMATKYDMDNADVRGKCLLSKLRFEYHYTPFKPSLDETICNLVEKLKMSKFCNLSLAFSLLCKRMAPPRAENLLQTHILPLANEYFNQALKNTDFDERISVILDIISKVVKPFPSDWDVEVYLNLFSRFLSNFNRAVIQESAVCAIIRLQRFGYVNCFHRLISFKPTFELSTPAQAMLKTFIHRKPLSFLNTITNQSRVNFS